MKKATKRLSTNEKLSKLANAREDEDILTSDQYQEEEIKAKNRLRINVLYKHGARAQIPKVKHAVQDSKSPFALLEPLQATHADLVEHTIQPGAHDDVYRIVQNNTRRNRNDPDAIFFTTTSCTEGVKFSHQPPWYYGYDNKTKPADGSLITAANRYGFRGTREINQKHTKPYEAPSRTRNEHTPKFLDGNDPIDEWVPPILATKFQTVNNMETPKFWPENSEFVTGYKKKKLPSKTIYNRETTVGMESRPQTTASLDDWFGRTGNLDGTIKDFAKMERSNTHLSLPMEQQLLCETAWKDRVSKTASSALRKTIKEESPPYNPQSLSDPSDHIRYAGPTAVITHTQSTEEFKFRLRMQRSQTLVSYDLRWKQVFACYRHLKSRLKRDMKMSVAIREVATTLRRDALLAGNPTCLGRKEFLDTLHKSKYFESFDMKTLSLTYTTFDPLKRNSFRFVEFIVSLAVIDNPHDSAHSKLGSLWNLYSEFGNDEPAFDIANAVLSSCNFCDSDRKEIEQIFSTSFRPLCYRMAMATVQGDEVETLAELEEIIASRPGSPGSNLGKTSSRLKSPLSETGRSSRRAEAYKNMSASSHPFNICDRFFSRETFVDAAVKCPGLIQAFDGQLSSILVKFFGKDVRYEVEDSPEPTTEKDFTWILDKKRTATPKARAL